MNESIVWSPDSIMNIAEDTMSNSSGTVSTSGSSLILAANSEAVYTYTFDTNDNMVKASNLRLSLNVKNSNETVVSRYNESVQVELIIQYYKEVVGGDGVATGYELGTIDTYQVNPYFNHETDGYFKNYDLDIEDTPLVFIEVKFINTSDNEVTFINPLVINSMTVMDAITAYGGSGGGSGGGGTAPELQMINDLVLYSETDKYKIDVYNGKLTLKVSIPPKYFEGTNNNRLNVSWVFETLSGNPIYNHNYNNYDYIINGVQYQADSGLCYIERTYSNGTFKVRASIVDSVTGNIIYDEKTISIINCNIDDVSIEVLDTEGKIRGCDGTKVRFTINNNLGNLTGNLLGLEIAKYDTGQLEIQKFNGGYYRQGLKFVDNVAETIVGGINDGKAKIILTPDDNVYPRTFKKEFIVDVVEATPSEIYLVADKTEIRSHNDIVNLTVTNNTNTLFDRWRSRIKITYPDGGKLGDSKYNGVVNELGWNQGSGENVATNTTYGLDKGKAILVAEMKTIADAIITYTSEPIEIDITFADEAEPTPVLESSTGVFSIDKGGGQLVLTPIPGYSWYDNYDYSKISVDGGDCDTSFINGRPNKLSIKATKDGTVRITAKPTYGPEISADIVITGQSPEGVNLSVDTETTKMLVGNSLIVRATPSNNPNPNNYRFRWDVQKLDTSVDYYQSTRDNDTAYEITGRSIGRLLVRCMDYNTYALLGTIELEVVSSLE